MKKAVALSLAVAMVIGMVTGCGSADGQNQNAETENSTDVVETENAQEGAEASGDADGSGETYKIGVIQLTEHAALDAANEGFVAALDAAGINYTIDQQNAQNDQSACQTIAEKLVNDGNDLILAIATPAAQAVAGATEEIPVLVTAVTDPADAGLVASNEAPGNNISGTSDLTPVKEQIELLTKLLPEAKKVGILYCSAESNSEFQADLATAACTEAGLETEIFTVSSSNEIQQVVESMVGKVDVLYAPTDNTIAAGMATVTMVANDNGLPTICGEEGMVDAGGLATYGINYYEIGYMAGEMAVDILVNGADVSTMPIGYLSADKCTLKTNQETADMLNIDLSVLD
ncbi:MAG: ABC transporter substrate-binding protein [Lachnospiraceae bacterium]|jgi:putative ABC transport system substrate-binding protein|nr:ABC transporter substrate-binding protein [Lachnospiraceae bacterium]